MPLSWALTRTEFDYMKRRRSPDPNSLDLLLDTICNTFGGVLFVALLVVILVRMGGNVSKASRIDGETAEDTSPIQAQLARREAQLKSLQVALQERQATLAELEKNDALDHAHRAIALRREVDDLSARRAENISKLTSASEENSKRERQLSNTVSEIAQLNTEVSQLQGEVLHERQLRSRTARLPVLHETSKTELPAILRFGRLYFPFSSNEDVFARKLDLDDFVVLEHSEKVTRVQPKPYAGIIVDTSEASEQEINSRLSAFGKDSIYLAIGVWEDSFAQFTEVKDILVQRGIEYRIVPVVKGDFIQEGQVEEALVQ
jgi:hypothetical protein